MIGNIFKSLVVSSLLLISASGLAQTQTPGSGNFTSGNSGNSGGFGIDFFAANVPGASTEDKGGLAMALEKAFGGGVQKPGADCGKLKCD